MKNHEYIRQLPVKELAKLLIKEVDIDEGYYDYNDNWSSDIWTYYKTPSGDLFVDEEEALQSTMDWLNDDISK